MGMPMKKRFFAAIFTASLAFSPVPPAWADAAHEHANEHAEAGHDTQELVAGVVRRVDEAAGKITIHHEPLINLGMPAMTMSFHVKDRSWLTRVKAGDKIRFAAESVGGALMVVRIEPSQ
jgi:Cu/Ag efflux protein CusF